VIDLRYRCPQTPREFGTGELRNDTAAEKNRKNLEKARSRVREIIESGTLPTENDFPKLWRKYRDLLSDAQHGKCAYCESRFKEGYPGAVEHYRPKTAAQEITRSKPGSFSYGRVSKPGYWWLAYNFENWVFSCFSCNTAKRYYFPLRAKRKKMKPGAEASEKPWLINPLREDPSGEFEFDEFGAIYARGRAAEYTRRVCRLDRGDLEQERKRTAVSITRDLEDYENAVVEDNDGLFRSTLRRLREACAPDAPYPTLRWLASS